MYELNDKEMIIVFTGIDGSGRKTVADMVGHTLEMKKVISYTTRERRPYEENGQDYHFITEAEFRKCEQRGEFLEIVEVQNNRYGVKDQDIKAMMTASESIYLILNPLGADILKKLYGDRVVRIFLYADRDTVTLRQKERGISDITISNNLSHYDQDMAYLSQCEHAYENYELAHVIFEISNTLETYLQRNLLEKD